MSYCRNIGYKSVGEDIGILTEVVIIGYESEPFVEPIATHEKLSLFKRIGNWFRGNE